jgi:site-specific DNA recombinase
MENQKNVGIWIRVSTEDQARGESPEHHEKRARAYAEAKGWCVAELYRLEAVSGKSVMGHPEAKRMLEDVKSGKITGLIFSKLARLARNTKELLEFSELFRTYHADLISLQEAIDTSSSAGRLFYTMIAAMAQWEREEIAERVAASVPIRAKLGKPTGGAAPFGYEWKDKKLILNQSEAPIRKLIFELFLQHRRKKTVARLLNESGYRTRNGGSFSDTTLDRLLRDPLAKGVRRANYTKSLGQDKKWVLKPESEWVLTEVEPIVSEELWTQCNAILDAHRNNRKPSKKTTHLFGGYVWCECGGRMYVPAMPSNRTPKYICRKCRNKIVEKDLEEIFQDELKRFFFSPQDIQTSIEAADRTLKEKQDLLATQQDEIERIKAEMNRLIRLHGKGEIPDKGFGRHYQPLEDRLEQLEAAVPTLQGEIDFLKIQSYSVADAVTSAQDLYSHWADLEESEKRQIVENITDNILIGNEEITINLNYRPASNELVRNGQHNLRDSSRRRA